MYRQESDVVQYTQNMITEIFRNLFQTDTIVLFFKKGQERKILRSYMRNKAPLN